MVSERLQRQLESMLDEAEAASARDWQAAAEKARAALAIDTANTDAHAYLRMAQANLSALTRPPGQGMTK